MEAGQYPGYAYGTKGDVSLDPEQSKRFIESRAQSGGR
jgi:hypothetical protein